MMYHSIPKLMDYLVESDTGDSECTESTESEETSNYKTLTLQASLNHFESTIKKQADFGNQTWKGMKEVQKLLLDVKEDGKQFPKILIKNEIEELNKLDSFLLPIVKKDLEHVKQTSRMFAILLSKLFIKHYSGSIAFCDNIDLFINALRKCDIKFQKDIFSISDSQSILAYNAKKGFSIFATIRGNETRVQILDIYGNDNEENEQRLRDFMKGIVFLSTMLYIETVVESNIYIIHPYLKEGRPSKYVPTHKKFIFHGLLMIDNEKNVK